MRISTGTFVTFLLLLLHSAVAVRDRYSLDDVEIDENGCILEDVCGDFYGDCCAPRSELKTCTREGLNAYCEDNDNDCCYYICCESAPEGYHRHKKEGLEIPGVAATASICVAIFLMGIVITVEIKSKAPSAEVHGIAGLHPDARPDAQGLLDSARMYLIICVLFYIIGAIFIDPAQAFNLIGTLCICGYIYGASKGGLEKAQRGEGFDCCLNGCLPYWCIVHALLTLGFLGLWVWLSSLIPAFGLYCAFCPAIITLDLMMLHHCRKLKAFTLGINQLGGSLAEGQQNHQAAPVIREIELAKNEPVVEATVMKTAPVTESTLAAMVTGGPFKEAGRQLTLVERLRELQTVRDQGLISNQEFEAAKVEVIKNYTAVV